MFAELGKRVLTVDLDPQANLTSMFLEERRLEEIWTRGQHPFTILGIEDFQPLHVEQVSSQIGLIPGDLGLSVLKTGYRRHGLVAAIAIEKRSTR
jgi:chromosome partitioning protein